MESYDIRFKPSVEKDLRRLPGQVVQRIMERIEALGAAPLAGCAATPHAGAGPGIILSAGVIGPPKNFIVIIADTFRADRSGLKA